MAITLADFGANVDEAQGKLDELLPQLDHGLKVIYEVNAMDEIGGNYYGPYSAQNTLGLAAVESDEVAKKIDDGAEKLDGEIATLFSTTKGTLEEDAKASQASVGELEEAQQTLNELQQKQQLLSKAAEDLTASMNEVQGAVESSLVKTNIATTNFSSARDSLSEKLTEATDRHNRLHPELTSTIDSLESGGYSTITQSGTGTLTLFDDTMSDLKQAADTKLGEIRDELDGLLEALKADQAAMTDDYMQKYRTMIIGLVSPMGEAARRVLDEMESLQNQSLDKLRTEIDEAQQTGEEAKSTTDEALTKVQDANEAKQFAAEMNQRV